MNTYRNGQIWLFPKKFGKVQKVLQTCIVYKNFFWTFKLLSRDEFFWKDLYIKIKGTFIHALNSSAQRRKTFDVYLNCKYQNMLMEFQWNSFENNLMKIFFWIHDIWEYAIYSKWILENVIIIVWFHISFLPMHFFVISL